MLVLFKGVVPRRSNTVDGPAHVSIWAVQIYSFFFHFILY